MLPAHIRAVFFDAVGTLIHPTPSAPHKYAEVAARYGGSFSVGVIRELFVTALRAEDTIDRAANWVTSEDREVERWRRVVAQTLPGPTDAEACFRELYDHYASPAAWEVDPHAGRVFAELRERGLILGLASNYDQRLERVIDGYAELRSLRPNIIISSQVGHRKPSELFFDVVMRTVSGLSVEEIAFVGDDIENDYDGAVTMGMYAVLFDPRGRLRMLQSRVASLLDL